MTDGGSSRANQKLRTRTAILDAASRLVRSGAPVSMPEVARAALVSEVTAYRYFPDLRSLLAETIDGLWPTAADALAPIAGSTDPVQRVAMVCQVLLEGVIAYQGAVRAMIAATITQPDMARTRPGIRFELIDLALHPARIADPPQPEALTALRRQLGVIISAESLFCLTDRFGLSAADAIASITAMATTLTAAAVRDQRLTSPG